MPKRSRIWRFLFILHFYAFLSLLAIGTIVGGAGLAIWKVPSARSWAHSEWVRLYLRNVAPKLPFTIEKIDVETKWHDFIRGKLARIQLDLKWSGWKISLTGPVDAFYDHRESETHINAAYDAVVVATPPGRNQKALPPLPLKITFRAGDHFSHLDTLNIGSRIQALWLPRYGVRARDLSLAASWDSGTASVKFSAGELSASGSTVADLALSASGPLSLKPFMPGPELTADLSVSRAVTAIDGVPLDLPLAKFPVHARLKLTPERTDFDISAPTLALTGDLETAKSIPTRLDVNWKTPDLTLRELIAAARAIRSDLPVLRSLKWLKKLSGSVGTSGTAHLVLPVSVKNLEQADIDADLRIRKLGFEWPGRYLALSGANLDLPISSRKGIDGHVSIDRILFRRFKARLAPTRLRLLPSDSSHRKFQLEVGSKSVIPLQVESLPLKISALKGTIDLADFDLETALRLSPTDASSLLHSLCIKADHFPPARISIDFPEIDIEPGTVDPDGKVEARLFDGEAELTNIGFYNLDTPVPETDFDLDMDGVRLDELGAWSGFGEMDGILRAYAHDVVMQAWLPTQYDFSFQAIPYSRPKVVFSPEAMRNVARLVAADAIDHLPGIVKWLAFGWPRRTFGGYDLYFFGVNLFSRDGQILFSTLDPPDLPATLSDEERRDVLEKQRENHYILYGLSFKIPLNTTQYPLFVSATEVSDYVHGMIEKFLTLAKLKEQAKLAATVKAVGSLKKAKEILWHEEHQMDCSPPAL